MNSAGDEPADPGQQQRPEPHAQQVVEVGRDRDAVPLADVADEQHLARRGGRRERPEHRQLAQVPGHDGERRTAPTAPSAAASGIRAGRRGLAAGPANRSPADPTGTWRPAPRGPARRRCARASRGRRGARPATKDRALPRRPRPARNSDAGDQRLVEREVVRLGHVDERQRRERGQDPGADAHVRAARPRPARSPRPAAPRARRSARTGSPRPSPSGPAAR